MISPEARERLISTAADIARMTEEVWRDDDDEVTWSARVMVSAFLTSLEADGYYVGKLQRIGEWCEACEGKLPEGGGLYQAGTHERIFNDCQTVAVYVKVEP